MSDFDPYRIWLGIPPQEQPPNYYRLLGLAPFESDRDVIANAADRQMAHLRTFQSGKNSAISQKILNEVAAARICLLNPKKRAEYDSQLRHEIEAGVATPEGQGRGRPGSQEREFPGSQATAEREISSEMPYHHFQRRNKNRWQGAMVALMVGGIGLPIAGYFIYLTVEEQNSVKQTIVKKSEPEKPSKNIPPPKANPPSSTSPEKKSAPNNPPQTNPLPKETRPIVSKPPGNNAVENEKAGKRLCFLKGNWAKGLPKLAASADERLKSLAEKELAAPEIAADRLAVADGWWKVSEQYAPPADKEIRRHAVEWYQKVIGDLEESDRDRAEWRIYLETPAKPGEKRPVNPDELE